MLRTDITWFGRPCLAICDHKCEKAWGHNGRRATAGQSDAAVIEYDDMDDVVDLADSEVGIAPEDPGTYEGGDAKPMHPRKHNKWCVRECERSSIIEVGEEVEVWDYSKRVYNQPEHHPEAVEHNQKIKTGEIYQLVRLVE
jgi:hypothetical protein